MFPETTVELDGSATIVPVAKRIPFVAGPKIVFEVKADSKTFWHLIMLVPLS